VKQLEGLIAGCSHADLKTWSFFRIRRRVLIVSKAVVTDCGNEPCPDNIHTGALIPHKENPDTPTINLELLDLKKFKMPGQWG
jgi:hypothetical protein